MSWLKTAFGATSNIKRTSEATEPKVAQMRVVGRGAAYIPSEEIAQLPEVKEMQRMAELIVNGRVAHSRK